MLVLSDEPALWDAEPEVPVLPNRESSSASDYALGDTEEGLGPESPSLIPNHQTRKRVVMLPPTLVVILFCSIKIRCGCDLHDKHSLWAKLTSLSAVQVRDAPPLSRLLEEGTGKVKAEQKGIIIGRICISCESYFI